jgi:hypothetical protein
VVIPADVHQPDEAALPAARNRKYGSKQAAGEFPVVLLTGNLLPVLPVNQCLDKPRFQISAGITIIRAECVVRWKNLPLLEIRADPIVPRIRNIFFLHAIS